MVVDAESWRAIPFLTAMALLRGSPRSFAFGFSAERARRSREPPVTLAVSHHPGPKVRRRSSAWHSRDTATIAIACSFHSANDLDERLDQLHTIVELIQRPTTRCTAIISAMFRGSLS